MNGRSRPVGRPQTPAGKSTSESNRAVTRTAADAPNLAMSDRWFAAFCRAYAEGVQYGYSKALDDIESADDAAWAKLSQTVRKQASSPRYSQLSARRGDHDRAEVARDRERRNGLELAS